MLVVLACPFQCLLILHFLPVVSLLETEVGQVVGQEVQMVMMEVGQEVQVGQEEVQMVMTEVDQEVQMVMTEVVRKVHCNPVARRARVSTTVQRKSARQRVCLHI